MSPLCKAFSPINLPTSRHYGYPISSWNYDEKNMVFILEQETGELEIDTFSITENSLRLGLVLSAYSTSEQEL